jgi:hypothetical protein
MIGSRRISVERDARARSETRLRTTDRDSLPGSDDLDCARPLLSREGKISLEGNR